MTCSCLWIRGAPEQPGPDLETGASAKDRPINITGVSDKHRFCGTNTLLIKESTEIFFSPLCSLLCTFYHTHAIKKIMTLHSASAVSMIRHTDHLSSLVMHIKNEFFPRQSLLALFLLGMLCQMRNRACVLKQNLGHKWDSCVIVQMLCNKTCRVGS